MMKLLVLALALMAVGVVAHDASATATGPICDICTQVVKSIELPLEQEGCQVFLPKYVEKACKYLGPFSGACVNWLEAECPAIFDLLEKGVASPQAICTDIHACGNSTAPAVLKTPEPIIRENLQAANQLQGYCQVCENLVPDFFKAVQHIGCDIGGKFAADIACQKWAPSLPGCSALAVKGCEAVVDAVNHGVTPDTICQFIHLCPKAATL